LRPLRDATSVGEDPQGRGGCFEYAAFYPEKPWQARPSYARRNVVLKPCARTRAGQSTILRKGMAMQLTGAEIVIRCLQEEGVEYVFGYPGGAVLNIYDELFKQEKVKHVLVRHEQGAVHAADGYSRSSTKVGVCLVTSGPGVTNAVTGIATAYMDSIPMVVLTGQVPTHAIGQDAFQECDTVGITRPCVKHNFLVKDAKDIALTIKKAFYLAGHRPAGARAGRHPQGRHAGDGRVELSENGLAAARTTRSPRAIPDRSRRPVQLLLEAKKPMVYAGGGVVLNDAAPQLTRLVRLLGFPCTNTLMGLGGFPGTDPQFTGMLGMHGTFESNMAMQNCDVLIAIGARFDDRVIGNPSHFFRADRKIIHIDIDPSSISKRVKVDVPIVGYVGEVLDEMLKLIESSPQRPDSVALKAWWSEIKEWQRKDCLRYDTKSDLIKPQHVLQKLYELTKGDAFITSDVGQHQMWAAQYYKFDKPRRWINSGGLGTMGFGLPAAMGVRLVNPGATVVCVTGEASIQMCIQELSTCKQYHLPIKIVNLNNRYMGMVRQWQEFFYGNRYAESYMDALPDFVKLAEAYGHVGMKIEKPGDVEGALRDALKLTDRLVFMDFITDQAENVFPMIAAGKGLTEMILAEEL
jgi:acetolactate synthase-1/2/3 large subunit